MCSMTVTLCKKIALKSSATTRVNGMTAHQSSMAAHTILHRDRFQKNRTEALGRGT